jgi:hypothetical protein
MEEKEEGVAKMSDPIIRMQIPRSVFKYIKDPPKMIIDPGGYNGTMIQLDRSVLEGLLANQEDFKEVIKNYDIILSPKQAR